MTKREKFIACIQQEIFDNPSIYYENHEDDWNDICDFWAEFCSNATKPKVQITENGEKILSFMQQNKDSYNGVFKSKDIAEGLFVSPKSVAGSMSKLIKEGFVSKIGGSPVCYELTDLGATKSVRSYLDLDND